MIPFTYCSEAPSPALGAADYRRWADDCARQAANARVSGDEREYLLIKRRSLIALAATEDWLNGEVRPNKALHQ